MTFGRGSHVCGLDLLPDHYGVHQPLPPRLQLLRQHSHLLRQGHKFLGWLHESHQQYYFILVSNLYVHFSFISVRAGILGSVLGSSCVKNCTTVVFR